MKKVSAIGNFDGVHIGHLKLLGFVKEIASRYKEACTSIVTFSPHTKVAINCFKDDFLIYSEKTKYKKFRDFGIEHCYVVDFNKKVRQLTTKAFVEKIIMEKFNISHVVVGSDFKFGFNANGNVDSLTKECSLLGIDVTVIDKYMLNKTDKYSSRNIRNFLKKGHIGYANEILGRTYFFFCKLEDVKKTELVYDFAENTIIPKLGVYYAELHFDCLGLKYGKIKISLIDGFARVYIPIFDYIKNFEKSFFPKKVRVHLIEFYDHE